MNDDDKKKDKIASLLNLPPIEIQKQDNSLAIVNSAEPETDTEKFNSDFDTARDAILTALETSQGALEALSNIASSSQHPRAFEVVAKLVDTIRDTSKDLLDIHQAKKNLIRKVEEPKTINNNLVISTSDLLKMIKGNQNE
jgi:hypothetical protein